MEVNAPMTPIQIQDSPSNEYKVGTWPKAKDIRKQAITIKNDLITALVKADARFAPSRLKNVLPAEASNARKAKRMYSIVISLLFLNKNKRPTKVSQLFI